MRPGPADRPPQQTRSRKLGLVDLDEIEVGTLLGLREREADTGCRAGHQSFLPANDLHHR
jgi:hypothetical protein